MKSYCVTACGTDIGKTFITAALCQNLIARGKKVNAIKPVISGWNAGDNDAKKILKGLSRVYTPENLEDISPWRLVNPLAPNMAAKLENIVLNYQEIRQFCYDKMQECYDYLFIEGSGGLMSPIDDYHTWFDLIEDLSIKVILVVGSYLGSISHALTAIKVLKNEQIQVVIINQNQHNTIDIAESAQFISRYSKFDTIMIPTIDPSDSEISPINEIINLIL